jgi:hypothetical protein
MLESLIGILGFLGLMALALCYSALSWGFVTYKFWGWFLPITFPSIAIPHLCYYQAIAFIMFLDLFKTTSTQQIKKEYKDETVGAIVAVITPWVFLGVGYFVYAFIIPKVM